jgi:large subunit ribosomal protein L29
MKENADKARALDSAEIHRRLGESSEQMFRLRFQMSMGQTEGLKKLRLMKKDRARMLTVLRERELHPENAAPIKAEKPAKKAKAAVAESKPAAKPAHAKAQDKAKPAAKKAASGKTSRTGAPRGGPAKPAAATRARKSNKG